MMVCSSQVTMDGGSYTQRMLPPSIQMQRRLALRKSLLVSAVLGSIANSVLQTILGTQLVPGPQLILGL